MTAPTVMERETERKVHSPAERGLLSKTRWECLL